MNPIKRLIRKTVIAIVLLGIWTAQMGIVASAGNSEYRKSEGSTSVNAYVVGAAGEASAEQLPEDPEPQEAMNQEKSNPLREKSSAEKWVAAGAVTAASGIGCVTVVRMYRKKR